MRTSTSIVLAVFFSICLSKAVTGSSLHTLGRHQLPPLQHHNSDSPSESSPVPVGDRKIIEGEKDQVPLCTEEMTFKIEDDSIHSAGSVLSADEMYAHIEAIDPEDVSHVRVLVRGLRCARGCCEHRLLVRPGGSDSAVLQHALGEYTEFLTKLKPHVNFRAILDAGGNIGVATMVFAHLFPHALVVVLEPQAQNCLLLKANTLYLPNVRVQCKGLWDKETAVELVHGGFDDFDWGWQIQEVEAGTEGAVKTTTVQKLMEEHSLEGFDFVKTDIEGAEFTVFGPAANLTWLHHTQLVAAEVHGWFGEASLIDHRLTNEGYKISWTGEYTIYSREALHEQLSSPAGSH